MPLMRAVLSYVVALVMLLAEPINDALASCAENAVTTAFGQSTAATSFSGNPSITTVTGTNTVLVCYITWPSDPGTVPTTATWNGSTMNIIGSKFGATGDGFIAFWGIVNPAAGAFNFAVSSWTNSIVFGKGCVELSGVNQTGGATTFPNTNSATGATSPAAVSVTTTAGDCAIQAASNPNSNGFATLSGGGTARGNYGSGANSYASADYSNVPSTSTSFSWSMFSNGGWASAAVDVAQPAVAPSGPVNPSNLLLLMH